MKVFLSKAAMYFAMAVALIGSAITFLSIVSLPVIVAAALIKYLLQ